MSLSRERELFEAAVLLPAGARESWLAEHCPDATMRARIERLLQAHERAEARDALRAPLPILPALSIGPYRLLERIGEGAMGEVYLAEQVRPVARRVALKVIKPGMDSREVIARFESERQTLALMSHPSIAHIIDAGTTDAGRPYFAMEYVPGVPVTQYCDRHRLDIDARLELFLQICGAVQHAHQKGVIHRDLKPSNLLVADLDGKPVPKVIDFGISKAMSSLHEPGRAHTRMGHLIGTPEYMSPEQAQLSPLDVDTRSDIYSLGVVLHELLTGILPFNASASTATPAELVQELLTHDPAAPSTRVNVQAPELQAAAAARQMSVRQLAARLSGDLDWIVLKTLEKDRNRRYASPSELAADIRRHMANQPVTAGPPSAVYRMRKFATRHRLALALVGGVFAATVAFGVLMARQAREIAVQRDEAKFQAQRAEASSEFMSLMLEEVGPGGRALTSAELLQRGVELLDKRYGDDPAFSARMLLQMARRFMDIGSTDKQAELLARAEALALEVEGRRTARRRALRDRAFGARCESPRPGEGAHAHGGSLARAARRDADSHASGLPAGAGGHRGARPRSRRGRGAARERPRATRVLRQHPRIAIQLRPHRPRWNLFPHRSLSGSARHQREHHGRSRSQRPRRHARARDAHRESRIAAVSHG